MLVVAASLVSVLTGCGSTSEPAVPVATTILASPTSATIDQGDAFQVVYRVVDQSGLLLSDNTARVTLSDTAILQMRPNLVVRAHGRKGSAQVIIEAGSARTTIPVTVRPVVAFLFGLGDSTRRVVPFDTVRLLAVPRDPYEAFIPEAVVTFTSSDTTRARVERDGLVRVGSRTGHFNILVTARAGASSHGQSVGFQVVLPTAPKVASSR